MGELCEGSARWEEREWLSTRPLEWWEDVFDRIADGERPYDLVKGLGMRFATLGRVLEGDLSKKAEYEAALRIAADGMAFKTLEILDAATPEDIAVAKARSDGYWRVSSRLNRDRWGERVQVEKMVKIEVDAGLVGFAGDLLARLSEKVVATIESEAPEDADSPSAQVLPLEMPPGLSVVDT